MSNPVDLTTKINNIDEQRELFLWKYRDVSREDVAVLLKVIFIFLFFIFFNYFSNFFF